MFVISLKKRIKNNEFMKKWFLENFDLLLEELFTFLRFKSISADPKCKDEIISCAKWLVNYLEKIGLNSKLLPTSSYPIVYGENKNLNKEKETILIYGHYDVQPADPLEEWEDDPFEPKIKNKKIYARGALDNKGQVFYTICAIAFYLKKYKVLPVNIKFCLEGEEETSSKGLSETLIKYKDIFKADYLLAVDFNILDENSPALILGARGLSAISVEFVGSNIDFHSGDLGGIAYNPLRAAVDVLSKLHDEKGRVAIDGFYDDVKEIPKNISLPSFDKERYKKEFGIGAFHEEEGYSLVEANWFRPTLEINGIGGGYFSSGFKTVIPKKVICKISARLVPDQDPKKIALLIKEFLQKHTKKGIEVNIDIFEGGYAIRGKSDSALAKALFSAMEDVFNSPCKYIYSGGSVPIIALMKNKLNMEPIMMGMGISSDNMHAPNEHFSLERFKKGFLCIVKALEIFGRK